MSHVLRPSLSRFFTSSTSLITVTTATLLHIGHNKQQVEETRCLYIAPSATFCEDVNSSIRDKDKASPDNYAEERIKRNERLKKLIPQLTAQLEDCETTEEAIGKVKALLREKNKETYEKHPCGHLLEKWHNCLYRQMAAKSDDAFLACAEPELFDMQQCLSNEKEKIKQLLIKNWGEEKFNEYVSEQRTKINALIGGSGESSSSTKSTNQQDTAGGNRAQMIIEELRQKFKDRKKREAEERGEPQILQEDEQRQGEGKQGNEIKGGWRSWFWRGQH